MAAGHWVAGDEPTDLAKLDFEMMPVSDAAERDKLPQKRQSAREYYVLFGLHSHLV